MTKQYFKWFDTNEHKPEKENERVLLKIQSESSPVVGYWSGWDWEVCKDNLCIGNEGDDYNWIVEEFYQSEVVAWMCIDMEFDAYD